MSRGRTAGLVVIAVMAFAAPGAQGAKRIGANLGALADAPVCADPGASGPHTCTDAIAGLSSGSAGAFGPTVPSAGVITSWRIRRGDGDFPVRAALRVIRGGTGAGTSEEATLGGAGTFSFATRLPVVTGDRIGVDLRDAPPGDGVLIAHSTGSGADLLTEWMPAIADGSSASPYVESEPGRTLLVNADVEPDADGDGYGDETQDACPTIPTTQFACAVGAPQTTISKKPRRKTTKARVSVSFLANVPGASFQCSVDGRSYRPCTSPLRTKRLRRGEHFILVRAVVNQVPDPTPARAKFTVVKKQRR
jgi:hypothetical protein